MPDGDREEYKSYGSMALESSFPGRKMVIYTLVGGRPQDAQRVTFGAFGCDPVNGPYADVLTVDGDVLVTTVPRKIGRRDVFLHIPQNFTLKYKGKPNPERGVEFATHYAVLVKTRSRETHQIDGHTYCVTLNQFRERFPDLNFRY